MTETTDHEPIPADDSDWLVADEPAPDVVESTPPTPGRRAALAAVGLVAAGALVSGVGVTALRSHDAGTTATTPTGFANGQLPNGQALPGEGQDGFAGRGPGGVDGEQRLAGTVTKVGSSSVTIRTAGGTTAYAVTAQTEIVRNGALASLSAIRAGDSVFVHLIPSNGSSYVVERLFAQSANGQGSDDGGATSGATT